MVGNGATEDLAAQRVGMRVFLLIDCLINREKRDLAQYPAGRFAQLREYVAELRRNVEG